MQAAQSKPETAQSAAPKPPATSHDSNPFTTAVTGIKKLFAYNTGPLVGVVLSNILLAVLIGATVFAIVLAIIAYVVNHDPQLQTMYPASADFVQAASSMNDVSIFVTLAAGIALLVVFSALMQAMQIKLAAASAASAHIGFGEVFKQGLRRTLPLLGLMALVVLVLLASTILISLLAQVLGPITIVLTIMALVVGIYVGLRLIYASFAVVDENKGPVAGLKRSWHITKGRLAEVFGIAAASTTVVFLPLMLLQALVANSGGNIATALQVVLGIVSLAIGAVMMAAMAERFQQLRRIADGQVTPGKVHVLNYLAILIAFGISLLIGALYPQQMRTRDSQTQDIEQYFEDFQRDLQNGEATPDPAFPSDQSVEEYLNQRIQELENQPYDPGDAYNLN